MAPATSAVARRVRIGGLSLRWADRFLLPGTTIEIAIAVLLRRTAAGPIAAPVVALRTLRRLRVL